MKRPRGNFRESDSLHGRERLREEELRSHQGSINYRNHPFPSDDFFVERRDYSYGYERRREIDFSMNERSRLYEPSPIGPPPSSIHLQRREYEYDYWKEKEKAQRKDYYHGKLHSKESEFEMRPKSLSMNEEEKYKSKQAPRDSRTINYDLQRKEERDSRNYHSLERNHYPKSPHRENSRLENSKEFESPKSRVFPSPTRDTEMDRDSLALYPNERETTRGSRSPREHTSRMKESKDRELRDRDGHHDLRDRNKDSKEVLKDRNKEVQQDSSNRDNEKRSRDQRGLQQRELRDKEIQQDLRNRDREQRNRDQRDRDQRGKEQREREREQREREQRDREQRDKEQRDREQRHREQRDRGQINNERDNLQKVKDTLDRESEEKDKKQLRNSRDREIDKERDFKETGRKDTRNNELPRDKRESVDKEVQGRTSRDRDLAREKRDNRSKDISRRSPRREKSKTPQLESPRREFKEFHQIDKELRKDLDKGRTTPQRSDSSISKDISNHEKHTRSTLQDLENEPSKSTKESDSRKKRERETGEPINDEKQKLEKDENLNESGKRIKISQEKSSSFIEEDRSKKILDESRNSSQRKESRDKDSSIKKEESFDRHDDSSTRDKSETQQDRRSRVEEPNSKNDSSLKNSNFKKCKECGNRKPESSFSACEECNDNLCTTCRVSCVKCKTIVCLKCGLSCMSKSHTQKIFLCGNCYDFCTKCSESFCPECLKECDNCGDKFCRACLETNVCLSCLDGKKIPMKEQQDATTIQVKEKFIPSDKTQESTILNNSKDFIMETSPTEDLSTKLISIQGINQNTFFKKEIQEEESKSIEAKENNLSRSFQKINEDKNCSIISKVEKYQNITINKILEEGEIPLEEDHKVIKSEEIQHVKKARIEFKNQPKSPDNTKSKVDDSRVVTPQKLQARAQRFKVPNQNFSDGLNVDLSKDKLEKSSLNSKPFNQQEKKITFENQPSKDQKKFLDFSLDKNMSGNKKKSNEKQTKNVSQMITFNPSVGGNQPNSGKFQKIIIENQFEDQTRNQKKNNKKWKK